MSEEENRVNETEPAEMTPDQIDPTIQLIGEGIPPPPVEGPLVEQSAHVESYPVDSYLWGPVNAAFCELCKRYGLPKGYQAVAFDRATGSFVVHKRLVE